MSHVACTAHSRRVVIIGKKVIHRNGDGSRCTSFTLKKHGSIWPRDTVFDMIEANNAGRVSLRHVYVWLEEMRQDEFVFVEDAPNAARLANAVEAHYSYLTD